MTNRISVRHSEATREYVGDIQRMTGEESMTDIVTRALHLYRDYLRMAPGAVIRTTGHTRQPTT